MSEPTTRATRIDRPLPWLLHWSIEDERIGGFRSDAYAVETPAGLLLIDALPLEPELENELEGVAGLFLTHGNHQRSAWRLRARFGAPVYAPAAAEGLDEEPAVRVDESTELPGGLRAVTADGFTDASYLVFEHADGTRALFCGDLLCQDPGGPLRFPVQPDYFDRAGGEADARRLLELSFDALCPAHAEPMVGGCRAALAGALAHP